MWEHHGTLFVKCGKKSVFNQVYCNELLFIAALRIVENQLLLWDEFKCSEGVGNVLSNVALLSFWLKELLSSFLEKLFLTKSFCFDSKSFHILRNIVMSFVLNLATNYSLDVNFVVFQKNVTTRDKLQVTNPFKVDFCTRQQQQKSCSSVFLWSPLRQPKKSIHSFYLLNHHTCSKCFRFRLEKCHFFINTHTGKRERKAQSDFKLMEIGKALSEIYLFVFPPHLHEKQLL